MGVNNASINFFSSNTGSYNTASSRIQEYGGTGSSNSSTIEIDSATFQNSTGFTGNKTQSLGMTFSNQAGMTGVTIQREIAVREGSWNRFNYIITGNMSASQTGFFSMSLYENWSDT